MKIKSLFSVGLLLFLSMLTISAYPQTTTDKNQEVANMLAGKWKVEKMNITPADGIFSDSSEREQYEEYLNSEENKYSDSIQGELIKMLDPYVFFDSCTLSQGICKGYIALYHTNNYNSALWTITDDGKTLIVIENKRDTLKVEILKITATDLKIRFLKDEYMNFIFELQKTKPIQPPQNTTDKNQEVANMLAGKWRMEKLNGEDTEDSYYYNFNLCVISQDNLCRGYFEKDDFYESLPWTITNNGKVLVMHSNYSIVEFTTTNLKLHDSENQINIELTRVK